MVEERGKWVGDSESEYFWIGCFNEILIFDLILFSVLLFRTRCVRVNVLRACILITLGNKKKGSVYLDFAM